MMKLTPSLKILVCLALLLVSVSAGFAAAAGPLAEADTLLKSPTLDLGQAQKALALFEGAMASGAAPRWEVLAQLARTCFILGQMVPRKQSLAYYRMGKVYADTLIYEAPDRVEGHYWLALNLCGQADVGGYLLGRRLLPRIVAELKRAVALDETYDQAGAHRVLGRIYFEAPGWPLSVGDLQDSLTHLKDAVRLAPDTSTNRLYLAQTLYRLNERARARQELAQVLQCTKYVVRPQDLEEDKREARRLLSEFKAPGSQ
jgi:tetratricopeptide (TPR) repeat protein